VETVLVVIFFALFSAMVACIIRPRDRRQSRRPVALGAATDSPDPPDPPFIDPRRSSRLSQLRDFFVGIGHRRREMRERIGADARPNWQEQRRGRV
jgi:hypothetical protein